MKPILRGPIAWRLFLFNILIVFMPVAGFFSLSLYEESLLAELESSMVQQGRIIAAWLQEAPLSNTHSRDILAALKRKQTARIRIVDSKGMLLADSSEITVQERKVNTSSEYEQLKTEAKDTLLYRFLSLPVRVARKYIVPPSAPLENADFYSGKKILNGPEIQRALSGTYGAVTRISSGGQSSVTLYSAIPIIRDTTTVGVVLVSHSTFRILQSLYDFRLETGKIFIVSIIVAALISLLLALTISRPLSRLKNEAESILGEDGLRNKPFHLTGRRDEIDRLSASLSTLVQSLDKQIQLSENFASDAAHEMRNRITGIRTSAELIAGGTVQEAHASIEHIIQSTGRMEKVIEALRELSKIETCTKECRTHKTALIVQSVVQAMTARHPSVSFNVFIDPSIYQLSIPVTDEHLEIIMENLLENAASFSPAGGTIHISMKTQKGKMILTVRDEGQGIPEEHRSRVFERFFSWRTDDRESHTGIGLSLVEVIMRKAGGSVFCANHTEGGAEFTLVFPLYIQPYN